LTILTCLNFCDQKLVLSLKFPKKWLALHTGYSLYLWFREFFLNCWKWKNGYQISSLLSSEIKRQESFHKIFTEWIVILLSVNQYYHRSIMLVKIANNPILASLENKNQNDIFVCPKWSNCCASKCFLLNISYLLKKHMNVKTMIPLVLLKTCLFWLINEHFCIFLFKSCFWIFKKIKYT